MRTIVENRIVALAAYIIRFRWLVVFVCIALTIITASGARNLEFSNNYRVFFSSHNPELMLFEKFQKVFSKNDNILVVIKAKEGSVFTPRTLKLVQELTDKAWGTPYSSRVDSITNFQHTHAEGDELIVADLVAEDPYSLSVDELSKREQIAINEPVLRKRLISPDASTTGINIVVQTPEKSFDEIPEAVAFGRQLIAGLAEQYPELEIRLSGAIVMSNAFSEVAQNDVATLIPLMYLVLILGIWFFLRSFWAMFGTLMIIGMAMVSAMGMAGFSGIPLTPPSATAPTIILTLAIADSIHFLKSMLWQMDSGMDKRAAIIESMRINFMPITITSLTTAIGFLSLNFSDAPPFWHLGNITAAGVTVAWLFSLTMLPAICTFMPLVGRKDASNVNIFTKIAIMVTKKPRQWLAITTLVALGCISGLFQLNLNDEFVRYFDKRVEFRRDTDFMMENLTGIYLLEFPIPAGSIGTVTEPEYLRNLEHFTQWLNLQPEVQHVYSLTDIMTKLNKNMHGDDENYFILPSDRELASQYLLLYEMSLPFGLDLTDRVNVDKTMSRVTVTLEEVSSVQMRDFEERAVKWLDDNGMHEMSSRATGPAMMFSYISERNIESMISGNIIAFILISLCIGLSLRSTKLGLISLVPNMLPAAMALGVWGYLVGQVNMAVAIIAAVSLGIIVDDTVHIMSKYRRGIIEKGLTSTAAVEYALSMTGMPLFITTVVLVAGFSILTYSPFVINKSMGLLNAITIAIALVMDLFLLPCILVLTAPKKIRGTPDA